MSGGTSARRMRAPKFELSAERRDFFRKHFPNARTDRQRQNIEYALIAMKTLGVPWDGDRPAEHRYRWLVDFEALAVGDPRAVRWGVLSELGRAVVSWGPEGARKLADITIKHFGDDPKARTKTIVAHLRAHRTRRTNTGRKGVDLERKIQSLIEHERIRDPSLTDARIWDALLHIVGGLVPDEGEA